MFIPASSVDLGLVSLHSVKIALNYLQFPDRVGSNYFLVRGREFEPDEFAGLTGEVREPFRLHSYSVPTTGGCDHA